MAKNFVPVDIEAIAEKLFNLRAYDPSLARRMEHEDDLPDDACSFLIERLTNAAVHCEEAKQSAKAKADEELMYWLERSFMFYLLRLIHVSGRPWCFNFPRPSYESTH